jgi:hypothetical protein
MRSTVLAALALLAMCVSARADELTVTAEDCRKLIQATESADVEYKPGVDVNGNPVVGADLDGGYPDMVPQDITIPIGVDLADRLGRARALAQGNTNPTEADRPLLPYDGTLPVGTITLRGNTVYWNDQELAPQDDAALAKACRERMEMSTPPPPKPEPPPK